MASFIFDVGFDWNATPSSDNRLPLFIGLVDESGPRSAGKGNLTYPFHPEDRIGFNGFNLTSGADEIGYLITGGSITFQAAADALASQTAPSPFSGGFTLTTGGPTGRGGSLIFTANTSYPLWTPLFNSQQISIPGMFQFTLALTIQGPGGTKTFLTDPEIIVQATV